MGAASLEFVCLTEKKRKTRGLQKFELPDAPYQYSRAWTYIQYPSKFVRSVSEIVKQRTINTLPKIVDALTVESQ